MLSHLWTRVGKTAHQETCNVSNSNSSLGFCYVSFTSGPTHQNNTGIWVSYYCSWLCDISSFFHCNFKNYSVKVIWMGLTFSGRYLLSIIEQKGEQKTKFKISFNGVPIIAQWKQIWRGTTRLRVRSLASLRGLRIQCCREMWGRLQTWLRSRVAVAVV